MPDKTEVQIAWEEFVKASRVLLVSQIDDRPLDQFFPFRDAVLARVVKEDFLTALDDAWKENSNNKDQKGEKLEFETRNLLLLELQAFPRVIELTQTIQKPEEAKGWWKKMLSRVSTVTGSIKDIVQNLPPWAKNALTLLKELFDLFKA
jgi:hypothetical protein